MAAPRRARATRERSSHAAQEPERSGPSDARASGQPPKRQRTGKRLALARELDVEIHALRTALDETLQTFGVRAHAELAAASRRLEDEANGGGATLPSSSALAAVLSELRGLKLKPRKGRAKDLTRIARALETLAELQVD